MNSTNEVCTVMITTNFIGKSNEQCGPTAAKRTVCRDSGVPVLCGIDFGRQFYGISTYLIAPLCKTLDMQYLGNVFWWLYIETVLIFCAWTQDILGNISCDFSASGKDLCGYFDVSDITGQSATTFWHVKNITYRRMDVNSTYIERGEIIPTSVSFRKRS